jgi:hypothetical protein
MSASRLGQFTPLFDPLVQRYGLVTASVYGLVWRYCQMRDGICRASLLTLAQRLSISRASLICQLGLLKQEGYIQDRTPDLRNRPHVLIITPKILTLPQVDPAAVQGLDTSGSAGVQSADSHGLFQDEYSTTGACSTVQDMDLSQTLKRQIKDELRDSPQSELVSSCSAAGLWNTIFAELASRLNRADLLTWVQPSRPLSWDGATLQVAASSSYARDWLTARIHSTALRSLQSRLQDPAARLEFVVAEPPAGPLPVGKESFSY